MSAETKQESRDRFNEEFNRLPLDEKFASLFQMEVATLSDAASQLASSSLKIFEKVGDAISDFGAKIESEAKNAARCSDSGLNDSNQGDTAKKTKSARKGKPNTPRTRKTT